MFCLLCCQHCCQYCLFLLFFFASYIPHISAFLVRICLHFVSDCHFYYFVYCQSPHCLSLLLVAAGIGTFFLFQTLSIEYEYLFVDGTLSIDKILGKARRKKVIECAKEDLLIVAPSDSFVLKDYETKDSKLIDCSSGEKGRKLYTFIYKKGPQHIKLLLEPNDKLIQAYRNTSPSKVVL